MAESSAPSAENVENQHTFADDLPAAHSVEDDIHAHPIESPAGIAVKRGAYIDGVGKYVAPEQNTLANHYALVRNPANELDFYPSDCPLDTVAAYVFKDAAFSNDPHPHYLDYQPLRENIAVVRNFILQQMTENGDLTKPEQNAAAINNLDYMGLEIGRALQRGSRFSLRGDTLDPVKASQPGTGAAEIYAFLHQKQESNKFLHTFKKMAGRDYSGWGLPPIDNSPFNTREAEAFRNNTPQIPLQQNPAPSPAPEAQPIVNPSVEFAPTTGLDGGRQLAILGSTLAGTAMSLERVRRLPKPVRDESIALARHILDNLRFGVGETAPRGEWMQRPEEQVLEESNALVSVANLYADMYNNAQAAHPDAASDTTLQQSNEALGKLAYLVKERSVQQLEAQGNTREAALLQQEIARYPDSWKEADGTQMNALLSQLNAGLQQAETLIAQAQAVGLSPVQTQAILQEAEAKPIHNPALLASTLDAQILQQLQAQKQEAKAAAPQAPLRGDLPAGLQHLSPQALAALQKVQGNNSARVATGQEMAQQTQQSHVEALGRQVPAGTTLAAEKVTVPPTSDYRSNVMAQQTAVPQDTAKTR